MGRNTKSIGVAFEDQYLKNADLESCTLIGPTTLSGATALPAPVTIGGQTITTSGTVNILSFPVTVTEHGTTVAINATATATAGQIVSGYITSTSAAATTITLPTGALLGAGLGAAKGTIFDLYIDNTAGASTVTIAVAVDGILSALAAAEAGGSGLLTVPAGVTGLACFRLMFSSATTYVFTRIA